MITEREAFLRVVECYLGIPYRWGGDDPGAGFDCSGLVIEGLKAVGRLPTSNAFDATANGILAIAKARGWECKEPDLRPGALVFYLNEVGRAGHIEAIWRNPLLSIGASGGGPTTTTTAAAIAQNAFVKVRPWRRRRGPYAFADPFREVEVPIPAV